GDRSSPKPVIRVSNPSISGYVLPYGEPTPVAPWRPLAHSTLKVSFVCGPVRVPSPPVPEGTTCCRACRAHHRAEGVDPGGRRPPLRDPERTPPGVGWTARPAGAGSPHRARAPSR